MSDLQERNNKAMVQVVNELNNKLNKMSDRVIKLEKMVMMQQKELQQYKQQQILLNAHRGSGATVGN